MTVDQDDSVEQQPWPVKLLSLAAIEAVLITLDVPYSGYLGVPVLAITSLYFLVSKFTSEHDWTRDVGKHTCPRCGRHFEGLEGKSCTVCHGPLSWY